MDTEVMVNTIVVGLGATLIMDLWAILVNRAVRIPIPNYCLVGRWVCHMTSGTFRHASITAAAQKPAECLIGWIAHYTIGVLFALGLVTLATPQWLQSPTLMPALLFGVVTVVFPFLILQPSLGHGIAASKAPDPMQARLRSLMNHAVFGIGLYVAALIVHTIAPGA